MIKLKYYSHMLFIICFCQVSSYYTPPSMYPPPPTMSRPVPLVRTTDPSSPPDHHLSNAGGAGTGYENFPPIGLPTPDHSDGKNYFLLSSKAPLQLDLKIKFFKILFFFISCFTLAIYILKPQKHFFQPNIYYVFLRMFDLN